MEATSKKKKNKHQGTNALEKVGITDIVMAVVLFLLCLTCILPFIHIAAKSVSSNTAVLARSVYLWPKGINFDAYVSIIKDGSMIYSILYSVILC